MASIKRNAPLSPSPAPFFTAILMQTKQLIDCGLCNVKTLIIFYKFTYFFQILGSNIRFPKIPKGAFTVDLYSVFSCKNRFAKVGFTITYLWTTQLNFLFLFLGSIDCVFWQLKIRILNIYFA